MTAAIALVGLRLVDSLHKTATQVLNYRIVGPRPAVDRALSDNKITTEVDKAIFSNSSNLPKATECAVSISERGTSVAIYEQGLSTMEKGSFPEAVTTFSKVLPEIEKELKTKSTWHIRGRDCDKRLYRSLIYQNRAFCYLQMCDYRLAIADLSLAIKLRPRYAVNYQNRARAYFILGDKALAKEDLQIAQKLPKIDDRYWELEE